MANEEHLKILRKGVAAWNEWKDANPRVTPDLSEVDLAGANLRGANLGRTSLGRANLNGTNFFGANLQGADLSKADLRQADLRTANLREADLRAADGRGARLSATNLCWSNLAGANLNGADLTGARLVGAQLESATLTEASLIAVNLDRAELGDADLTRATINTAVLGNTDLSGVKGLESVRHLGPSTIGIDTIYKSKGNIPEIFLRGAGVPENFITYMKSLAGSEKAFEFYSCFISYSTKDQEFADRLYNDLQANNVRCWKFDENAKWGEPLWGEIDTAIRHYDKLLVICSEHSLQSPPVVREIERALQKEDRERKGVLFPVRIDDYLFERWDHPRKADVVSKVVGNFCSCDHLPSYAKAFKRFLDALNRA